MKREKNKRPKVNLILSHVNHTFLILNLKIGPKDFKHTCCTIEKKCIFNVKKGLNSKFNLLQIGPWAFSP